MKHVLNRWTALLSSTLLLVGVFFSVSSIEAKSRRTVKFPDQAKRISYDTVYLGSKKVNGKTLQGYAVITFKKGYHHRNGHGGGGGGKPGRGDKCYAVLAKGARWKTVEPYIVDTTNLDGMSGSFVQAAMASATQVWNNAVSSTVFGSEIAGVVDQGAFGMINGKNEVFFADIDEPGAVAVTLTWGIWSGPPSGREIVEWDQIYDDVDYDFGDAALDATVMDLQGVGAHEVGHAGGLGHPADTCRDETMYAFVTEGETKKRDLNAGDIAGFNELY